MIRWVWCESDSHAAVCSSSISPEMSIISLKSSRRESDRVSLTDSSSTDTPGNYWTIKEKEERGSLSETVNVGQQFLLKYTQKRLKLGEIVTRRITSQSQNILKSAKELLSEQKRFTPESQWQWTVKSVKPSENHVKITFNIITLTLSLFTFLKQ